MCREQLSWMRRTNAHRLAFNATLFISGVFAIAAGGAPNFVALASLFAVLGVGVGGNLPVDSAVFLGETTHVEAFIR